METSRRFNAKFIDKASKDAYYTWSAAQTLVYNSKVQENDYFYAFSQKFWTPEKRPLPDQKYSHLIDKNVVPWVRKVPSQVLRNGATLFYRAVQGTVKNVSKKPRTHRIKGADRKLFLTRELFTIRKVNETAYDLIFGTKRCYGGKVRFKAHRPFTIPASVHIKTHGGRVAVSFTCDDSVPEAYPETQEEIIARLRMRTEGELLDVTEGFDRGVVRMLQSSSGETFNITQKQKERIELKEKRRKHYQRMMARREKGSENWKKASTKVASTYRYRNNVLEDFAHQTSHKIVSEEKREIFAFEKLNVAGMTKAPKPKLSEDGRRWVANGASAKAGLNRSILRSAWGKVLRFTKYKAQKAGKLVIEVNPAYTSQTCSRCGCTAKENRKTQSVFQCTSCWFTDNADHNAATVIKKRAVEELLRGEVKTKNTKKVFRTRKRIGSGAERPASACGGTTKGRMGTYSQSPQETGSPTRTAYAGSVE